MLGPPTPGIGKKTLSKNTFGRQRRFWRQGPVLRQGAAICMMRPGHSNDLLEILSNIPSPALYSTGPSARKFMLRPAESSSHCHVYNLNNATPLPPIDSSISSRAPVLHLKQLKYQNLLRRDNSSVSQASENELVSIPRPPQCRNMYMRQNHPPGDALGKELNTKKLVAPPPPQASARKSFQKRPSEGIGVPKVLSYGAV